jgi:hypothetical protein
MLFKIVAFWIEKKTYFLFNCFFFVIEKSLKNTHTHINDESFFISIFRERKREVFYLLLFLIFKFYSSSKTARVYLYIY